MAVREITIMTMIINVALLPSAKISDSLVGLSNSIGGANQNGALLGRDGLPHITLAQVKVGADLNIGRVVKIFEQECKDLLTNIDDVKITFAGLAFVVGEIGDLWVELPILKTELLNNLHREIVRVSSEFGKVVSGCLDDYRPHATLGYFDNSKIAPSLVSDISSETRVSSSGWELALSVSGKNYAFSSPGFAVR